MSTLSEMNIKVPFKNKDRWLFMAFERVPRRRRRRRRRKRARRERSNKELEKTGSYVHKNNNKSTQ
jgi:hypothetical protein